MMHAADGRKHFPAFGIKHLILHITCFHQILAIAIVGNRFVSKLCHHSTDSVPSITSTDIETIDILFNQANDITTAGIVTVKECLFSLVLWITYDNGI